MIKAKQIIFTAVVTAFSALSINAQTLKTPAPSPTQTLKQNFALSDITIEYSRPSVKDRVIFGDIVPFGKTWRTGANGATKITFGDTVKVEGKVVPAGTYALYTVPNKSSWDIIFYKDLTIGGNLSNYKPENEFVRFAVKPTSIPTKVETFTINIANITPTTATIELVWDKTRVAFSVVADIDARISKNIETALAPTDTRPYFQSANYYYETNKDQKQALEWINKAIEQNPKAFYMFMLKARIQFKLKDNTGALATAQQVIPLAQDAKNDDYVNMANKFIAEVKKAK
jgi:hypothetical protein